jgi:DeoR/GlpR family transcriptional regulator of sugar metabolism
MVNNIEIGNRQQAVLEYLEQKGACSYQELIDRLGVSNMTVRRTVDRLAELGAVIKTLGGVQKASAPPHFYESAVLSRLTTNQREKQAIAALALEEIWSGQTLFLDGSTTCLELAKLLAGRRKGLTVVTNSALVCLELGRGEENQIVGIGGQYDPGSLCFGGPAGEGEAKSFFVDHAFFSTKGFLPAEGTFESVVATFRIKQIIARQCSQVSLLVDSSKFGKRALCKVLDLSQIHRVITDDKAARADLEELRSRGKTVEVATVPASAE